ncbi:MAG TPA: hypothetical protein VK427_23135 [Kofleriaceae bacterium]|nr:hypothetical protein [Kofleriaceae bacterium]
MLAVAGSASAQPSELVVFGPEGNDAASRQVADALANAKVGVTVPRILDAACIASTTCVVAAGVEASGRQALAVVVANGTATLVLVDVLDRELVATRDVPARTFAQALPKFLAEAATARARALFATGKRHYELGEFTQALDLYKRAYRVKPLSAFQFNIAQCHRKLAQHREAVAMYQAYLVETPEAANRTLVESLIAESRASLQAQTQTERARLAAEASEQTRRAAEASRQATLALRDTEAERRKQLQARLAAERQRALDATYDRHPTRRWMIATGALGLAAAGVGGYFGMQAREHQAAFDDAACGDPRQTLPASTIASCHDHHDAGRRAARLATILMGTGGALALGSLIVYALDPGNVARPRERATISFTPSSVQVHVRW